MQQPVQQRGDAPQRGQGAGVVGLARDLAIGGGLLAALCILYIFRFLDGNTLASWRWTFTAANFPRVAATLLGTIVVCRLLARFALAGSRATGPRHALLAAGAVLAPAMLLAGQPEMLLDAGRYLIQATYLAEYGPGFFLQQWGRTIPAWTDQPLGAIVYGLLFSFFGQARTVVLAVNVAALFLTLVLTHALGRTLLRSQEAGWTAAFLLLGSPYLLVQLPLMLVDILTMLAMTLAIFTATRALRHGGRLRLISAGLALALALLAKYSTWPMLLGIPLLVPLAAPTTPAKSLLRRGGAIILAASGALLPYIAATWPLTARQLQILATFQRQGLAAWQEGALSIFFFQICPALVVLAAIALWRVTQRRAWRYLGLCWFIVFAFLFHAWRLRYLLPLLPLFALLAALGLHETVADRQ
ncbi:MAG TPA: phospholipid carrier-dependent glycosyltransferase, partial [Desulfobacterales bacterium]|nr:phospholipid carrier-dependent glycosyltransferase [Desulfobacterales bacterium]